MQLTPEQQAQIDRQRRESPGARLHVELTPEQQEQRRQAVAEEEAGRAANIAAHHARQAAGREAGLSGDLRRAINASGRRPDELAEAAGIDVHLLSDFRAGTAVLPSDAVDRLAAALGLRLMAEIRG